MTINEIARLAGVSRGTVDRVLHNRGKVDAEKERRIREIIKETGFTPNIAAMALKRSTDHLRLGVLLPPRYKGSNPFYDEVIEGVKKAVEDFKTYGVTVDLRYFPSFNPKEVTDFIRNIVSEGVDGLAMVGIDSQLIKDYIASVRVPVVTLNTDFTNSSRLCFVGQNHLAAGRTAGRLLCRFLQHPGKIAPLISFGNLTAHTQRVEGMSSMMRACPWEVEVLPSLETHDSVEQAYDVVAELIRREKDLACIYVAGGGQTGASQALADSGRAGDITMACYDLLPQTLEHIRQGVVDFTIGQQPRLQGYLPVSILYDYLVLGRKPEKECYYTAIDIRLPENVDYNGISVNTGLIH